MSQVDSLDMTDESLSLLMQYAISAYSILCRFFP